MVVKKIITNIVLLSTIFVFLVPHDVFSQSRKERKISQKVHQKLEETGSYFQDFQHLGNFKLDSVAAHRDEKLLQLYFNKEVSYIPVRENIIAEEECRIKSELGWYFRNYNLELYAGTTKLTDLVPNYYRSLLTLDSTQFPKNKSKKVLYRRPEEPVFSKGLVNKHIALWHSHGKYYESSLDRWEWQRARLHTTVEDLLTMSFVVPYLSKMLENAGAITLIPRERDIQIHEVIVDEDHSTGQSELQLNRAAYTFERIPQEGFLWKEMYKARENPFKQGSYLVAKAKSYPDYEDSTWVARYIPDIPKSGKYALYVSYGPNNAQLSPVKIKINSQNGVDLILLDQSMGAQSWIYLGQYDFDSGLNPGEGSVEFLSDDPASIITLDAIKIGGGVGNIARRPGEKEGLHQKQKQTTSLSRSEDVIEKNGHEWKTSGSPRYMEAARYFLQYSGMPDTLVYDLNRGKNDYKDDFQCRGEWVNYLLSNPYGPGTNRVTKGLGIPVDLSLAFHTDAGTTSNDSIIGTLAIYNSDKDTTSFPDGRSKLVNRELSDLVQSQIVQDIRKKMNPEWTRRGLWNKEYSEAYRANVPSMLLELLSHQNLADMNYGLDPEFRFLVCRAIYKSILKFLAFQDHREYVVQPLPVDHFKLERSEGKTIRLSWRAVTDFLEPTGLPDHYEIYVREDDGAFRLLERKCLSNNYEYVLPEYDKIYSFKIIAVNQGGKSFPGEVLATAIARNSEQEVLIVNAFDRLSAPAIIDKGDFAGIAFWEDEGVPYLQDIATTGMPYDFNRNSPWLDDDSPGWGASHADLETRILPGNSFDFVYQHGKSILQNGYSFVSSSDESFIHDSTTQENCFLVDVILGEEKTKTRKGNGKRSFSVFTSGMMNRLKAIQNAKIPIFISGAHIGSDMIAQSDTAAIRFAAEYLHYTWRTDHADRMGLLYGTDYSEVFDHSHYVYNAGFHPKHYKVESPDAIEAADSNSVCLLRYRNSNACAAVGFGGIPGTLAIGFPFESVLSQKDRNQLMSDIIRYLTGEAAIISK